MIGVNLEDGSQKVAFDETLPLNLEGREWPRVSFWCHGQTNLNISIGDNT